MAVSEAVLFLKDKFSQEALQSHSQGIANSVAAHQAAKNDRFQMLGLDVHSLGKGKIL